VLIVQKNLTVTAAVFLLVAMVHSAESKLTLTSSSSYLETAFQWNKSKALSFVETGKGTNIPCYRAALPWRDAYCIRDASHMAEGACILGLTNENLTMWKSWAALQTAARKYFTIWEVDFAGNIFPCDGSDYLNDNVFWRMAPAMPDLIGQAYQNYRWSGDVQWITDKALTNFYKLTMSDFMIMHDANGDFIPEGTGECPKVPNGSYCEMAGGYFVGGDTVAVTWDAYKAYSKILTAMGKTSEAAAYDAKANSVYSTYTNNWWDSANNNYYLSKDVKKNWVTNINQYTKEQLYFMAMKGIAQPGARADALLDAINNKAKACKSNWNQESFTMLPMSFYNYGKNERGWYWLKYIMDKKYHYPECSFLSIDGIVRGMMGVEAHAPEAMVSTLGRLPSEVSWVQVDHIPVGKNDILVKHENDKNKTTVKNNSGPSITWQACVAGFHSVIYVNGFSTAASQKSINGVTVSYVNVPLASGQQKTVSVPNNPIMATTLGVQNAGSMSLGAESINDMTWTANWIWQSTDGPKNTWVAFRKTFDLANIPAMAKANIGVDSKYWLWINGKMVVFEGGIARGPSPGNTYYDEIDIRSHLKTGVNTIAVLVWHWGRNGWYHVDSGKGGLVFQATLGGTVVNSDSTWKMKVHPGYNQKSSSDSCGGRIAPYGITYDGNNSLGDWTVSAWHNEGYNDSAWECAVQKGVPSVAPWNELERNYVPTWKNWGLQDYASLSGDAKSTENTISLPHTTTATEVIYAWLDFNKQVTPYIEMNTTSGKVVNIDSEYDLTYIHHKYVTRDGDQAFEGYSWNNGHAMKYTIPAGVTIKALKYRWTSVGQQAGYFECSDPYLQKLWWMAKNTLFVCARDNFMDCPNAERSLWIGDVADDNSHLWYVMDDAGRQLMKKAIKVFCAFKKDGAVLHAPTPGSYTAELPDQSLQFIGWYGTWWYYYNSGDYDTLAYAYPYFKDYVNLWTMNANGLINRRTGGKSDWDWSDHGEDIDNEVIQNCLYYMAMKAGMNMALALGKTDDVRWYQGRADSIRKNFDSVYWNGKYYAEGTHKDDRANALAIVTGLSSPDKHSEIVNNVLSPIRHASPHYEWIAEEACCIAGRYDVALSRMHSLYDNQVLSRRFLTTLREERNRGTYNHAWNCPDTILSRYFTGITPAAVAWSTYNVLPYLHDMSAIHQIVPSVKGIIDVSITRSTTINIDLISPFGTTAIVGIPKSAITANNIMVNGVSVWNGSYAGGVNGISWNGEDGNFYKFNASPGKWKFVASGTLSPIPVSSGTGPAGYTWCANEGETVNFTQPVDVAYGAEGSFKYLVGKTGPITFGYTAFGDPIPDVVKAGYYKSSGAPPAPAR
jgi:hypothetical protein